MVSAVEWVSANQMFSAQRRTAGARGSFIFDSLMATSIVTSDCPTSVYKAFLAAESRGKYFSQYNRNRFQNDLVYRKRQSKCRIAVNRSGAVLL